MSTSRQMTILLVDDDEGHQELVRRNLQRIGVNNPVVSLANGQEALDYLFCRGAYANRPEISSFLILLDIRMPGEIDGVEVLRQIKANSVKKKIPVIMLTTTDDPREIRRCYELGCSIYITKPVDPLAFIEAIKRLGLFLTVVSVPPENGERP